MIDKQRSQHFLFFAISYSLLEKEEYKKRSKKETTYKSNKAKE
jgi:hypothetical protein